MVASSKPAAGSAAPNKVKAAVVDFKKEIEEKFAKSKLRVFRFPLKKPPKLPDAMRSTRYNGVGNSP